MAEQTPAPEPVDEEKVADSAVEMSQWEFVDVIPTRDDVIRLLGTLRPVFGVSTVDYADYVQALPQNKKVEKKVRMPNGSFRVEEEWHEAYTLYMSVAGRIKMANAIAEQNGWALDFEPEPATPTGIPGMLQTTDGRIVYREYATFRDLDTQGYPQPMVIGRKSGTAWVPYSGGKQAAKSNPYEKVETSARGRALGAWGIGVLPGSGIATMEEMLGVNDNRAAMEAQSQAAGQQGGGDRVSREELLEMAKTLIETVRQRRSIPEDEMADRTGRYLSEQMGIRSVYDAEAHEVDWAKVKDGQLQLLINSMRDSLRQMDAQENPL